MKPDVGLVIWSDGSWAKVVTPEGVRLLPVPGRLKFTSGGARAVCPGDRVELEVSSAGWRMASLLPRTNHFTRRAAGPKPIPQTVAVNLDLVLVVASVREPATPFGLVDRLLVAAHLGGCRAEVVVNKADLASAEDRRGWTDNYQSASGGVWFTSAVSGEGVDELQSRLRTAVVLLAGPSGVGKSSLLNRIDPSLNLRVRPVNRVTGKGRHTTSTTALFPVSSGGWVGDTPGLRECGLWNLSVQALREAFPEIARLGRECRFANCIHLTEPGCRVRPAAGSKDLAVERYHSYLKLLEEARR